MAHKMSRRGWCPPLFAQHDAGASDAEPASRRGGERSLALRQKLQQRAAAANAVEGGEGDGDGGGRRRRRGLLAAAEDSAGESDEQDDDGARDEATGGAGGGSASGGEREATAEDAAELQRMLKSMLGDGDGDLRDFYAGLEPPGELVVPGLVAVRELDIPALDPDPGEPLDRETPVVVD